MEGGGVCQLLSIILVFDCRQRDISHGVSDTVADNLNKVITRHLKNANLEQATAAALT